MTSVKADQAQTVVVNVTDINVTKTGNIMVMLFGKEGFPKKHQKALQVKTLPVQQTEITVKFVTEVERVAIKVLHDENKNGQVTKDWTGIIPAEGLGFSNGAKLSWRGAPTFKGAAFDTQTSPTYVSIPVIYPN